MTEGGGGVRNSQNLHDDIYECPQSKQIDNDMFKQHENSLCICYSTQKTDFGTVVGFGNIF